MENEKAEHRLKRLAMRAARRGTKEMDLILGPYALAHLAGMDENELDLFENLLNESDLDLYRWVTGQDKSPGKVAGLIEKITDFANLEPVLRPS